MDLKILSALIGLCGAVSNNGKTENTDRLVLEAILSKEPEDAVRRIHEEKYFPDFMEEYGFRMVSV